MKNYRVYKIYMLLPLIFFMASCQKDHDVEIVNLGSEFFITESAITSLDTEITITIENQQKNLAQVTATLLPDTDLGSIQLTDGAGSETYTDAQTGLTEIGDEGSFKFGAEHNGMAFSRSTTITVEDPISIEAPEVVRSADISYLHFSIEPAVATVDGVVVQTKLFTGGTYENATGDFNAIDSLGIIGADFNLYDTLFVKVTGTAGTKTAETVTKIVIMPNVAVPASFILMMDEAFDLINDSLVLPDAANADIEFTGEYTTEGLKIGFNLPNAEFVIATEDEYALADRLTIESADFSTVITANDNVAGGEIYYFRTRHDAADDYFYGMLKIMNVDKPQGVLEDSSIEYEFKH